MKKTLTLSLILPLFLGNISAQIIDYLGTNTVRIYKGDATTPVFEFTGVDSIVFAKEKTEKYEVPVISEAEVSSILAGNTTMNLNDFVDTYMTEKGNWLSAERPYPARATYDGKYYVYSIDTIPIDGKPIFLRARIADIIESSIKDSNTVEHTQDCILQQIVNGKQQTIHAPIVLPDSLNLIGQEILIRMNGLAVGRNMDQVVLCVPRHRTISDFDKKGEEKWGWRPGVIKPKAWNNKLWFIGQPDASKIMYEPITISSYQDVLSVEHRRLDGSLVEINGIHFTGQYFGFDLENCTDGDPTIDANARYFAPTTNGVHYPQSRIFTDGTDISQSSCYEWSSLALVQLPATEFTGTIRGVLSFIYDNPRYEPTNTNWSIMIRSVSALDLHNAQGEPWVPVIYDSKK